MADETWRGTVRANGHLRRAVDGCVSHAAIGGDVAGLICALFAARNVGVSA